MKRKILNILVLFIILSIILIGIMPIVLLFIVSFSSFWRWPDLWPVEFNIRPWKYVFTGYSATIIAIKNSFIIAIIVDIINIIIAIPAADALARYEFKGKKLIKFILIVPIIIPPLTILMGIHKTFIGFGLTENTVGVILVHIMSTLPYMIMALEISYKNLGFKWEDAAKVMGASPFKRFLNVTLPFILPGVIAGSSLTLLISLNQYITTLFIGGGEILTLPIFMFPFISGGDKSIGAAYSILFALLSFISLWILDSFIKRHYR
ncbi:ABC transporter permease [Clostridium algidicarnis]|uniref:ABC transporter permease n=1 Tax=Clostridium algidicarnis TaxID=37659 RepID=UPI001C0E5F55|nr:ABC transporter permease subunit [Clostridium algidicarnis]MBU3203073.1 ABC transporter permease subunit [Clostridium algidicarnis]MBU3211227.1 ABC transporter permease subunit [Clostridium algidicarnis]MBU3222265.1 ABC transporter permease subunit [Clostridium algidicarnis]